MRPSTDPATRRRIPSANPWCHLSRDADAWMLYTTHRKTVLEFLVELAETLWRLALE